MSKLKDKVLSDAVKRLRQTADALEQGQIQDVLVFQYTAHDNDVSAYLTEIEWSTRQVLEALMILSKRIADDHPCDCPNCQAPAPTKPISPLN